MVITVRWPFLSSATCEALLLSLELEPATKKPQNADAGCDSNKRTSTRMRDTPFGAPSYYFFRASITRQRAVTATPAGAGGRSVRASCSGECWRGLRTGRQVGSSSSCQQGVAPAVVP